ncbi:MAG: type II toxin-antitoxin system HicB family antitoxin [Flexilinea sp.]
MKRAYPIVITMGNRFQLVSIPDFGVDTQGTDVAEAMEMARDAIGLLGIDMEDEGKSLPKSSDLKLIEQDNPNSLVTLVDVDFDEYRRGNEMRAVRKNCTIPSWLNTKAEKEGINFSEVLQKGLKKELNLV